MDEFEIRCFRRPVAKGGLGFKWLITSFKARLRLRLSLWVSMKVTRLPANKEESSWITMKAVPLILTLLLPAC